MRKRFFAILLALALAASLFVLPVSAATSNFNFSRASNQWTTWNNQTWISETAAQDVGFAIPPSVSFRNFSGVRMFAFNPNLGSMQNAVLSVSGDTLTMTISTPAVVPDPPPATTLPSTAAAWQTFTNRYAASHMTTHHVTDTRYGDHHWGTGNHILGAHNELLDTSSNQWITAARNLTINVPEFYVLIVSNGDVVVNHYFRVQGQSRSVQASVAQGNSYRLMRANDLGTARWVVGAFQEAVWHLEQWQGAIVQNATLWVFGNGRLVYEMGVTPMPARLPR